MASLDIEAFIKKATLAQLENFKDEVRRLQETAWNEGYNAAENGHDKNMNPYQKEY